MAQCWLGAARGHVQRDEALRPALQGLAGNDKAGSMPGMARGGRFYVDYSYTIAVNQGEPEPPQKPPRRAEAQAQRGRAEAEAQPSPGRAEAQLQPGRGRPLREPPAAPISPVLGWLVAASGARRGQDWPLLKGVTHIARSMDIEPKALGCADGRLHLAVAFDAQSGGFYVRQESGEPARLLAAPGGGAVQGEAPPDRAVQGAALAGWAPLRAYDAILAGDLRLVFMPFCDGGRRWA
ncbi:MAG: hypothetical protein LBL83_06170 [Clostridiales bacterium]|jgi:hypothetical protein|nr:hypothetical protein [Clostridiales bacterium]